ncbi:MAG: alanine racemase [Devosiaceae bacterium]
MHPFHAGARLTIDLKAIADNWRALAQLAQPGACGAAVKADAYGLGLEPVSRALWAAGCRTFFVALPDEAFALRAVLPDAEIYCLGGLTPGGAADYLAHTITPVLNSLADVEAWIAQAPGVHTALHVDTGMNRLGLRVAEAETLALNSSAMERLNLRYVMSHLACADEPDHPLNSQQIQRFASVCALFPGVAGSLSNSAGTLLGGAYVHDLARPGIALYGGASAPIDPNPIQPVVQLDARILQVRQAYKGEPVGYGAAQTLSRDTRLAILGVGYADGYHRLAGSSDAAAGSTAKITGHNAPFVGRISMDLIAIDISEPHFDHVTAGDFATLIDRETTVDGVAKAAQTIGYEVLTSLGRRYHRDYINDI